MSFASGGHGLKKKRGVGISNMCSVGDSTIIGKKGEFYHGFDKGFLKKKKKKKDSQGLVEEIFSSSMIN